MNLSYHLDVSSGATIVLVGSGLFLVIFLITGPRELRRLSGSDAHGIA